MEREKAMNGTVEQPKIELSEVQQILTAMPDSVGFGGVRRLKRDPKSRVLTKSYGELVERLARQRPGYVTEGRYYEDVFAVVLVVSNLRAGTLNTLEDDRIAFELGVMSDHCRGLPADSEIVDFLRAMFTRHSYSWIRLHSAQCMGYLAGGLPIAQPLFVALFDDPNEMTRTKAAEILSRVLENQGELLRRMSDESAIARTRALGRSGEEGSWWSQLSAFAWAASKLALVRERRAIASSWRLLQPKEQGGGVQMSLRRVIGEVESVAEGNAVVQVTEPGLGWYSLLVPCRALPTPPEAGQRVDVDVWHSKGLGVVDFGIPGDVKVYPPLGRKSKPPSSLPPEPTDFSDEGQMQQYLTELQKFFRLD
jgi:hypothetical protein